MKPYNQTFYRRCIKAILEHKDWKIAMRTNHKIKDAHGTMVPETPLRLLIKNYPDLAEEVFNNCITNESIKDSLDPLAVPSNCLYMDYEFIDDAFYLAAPESDEEGKLQTNFLLLKGPLILL